MTRRLVAEDYAIVRTALVQMLASIPDIHVVAEAADAGEVLDQPGRSRMR